MPPLTKTQKTEYSNQLKEVTALQKKMLEWPANDTNEYRTLLSKINLMVTDFNHLDINHVTKEESGALLRSLSNCLKLLTYIDNAANSTLKNTNNQQIENTFAQLNKDLPVLMNSKNPEVRNNCWNICKLIVSIIGFVAVAAAVIFDIAILISGNAPAATEAMMNMWFLSSTGATTSDYAATPNASDVSSSKQAGKAMNEFKDAVPAYKSKLMEIESTNKTIQSNIEMPPLPPTSEKKM